MHLLAFGVSVILSPNKAANDDGLLWAKLLTGVVVFGFACGCTRFGTVACKFVDILMHALGTFLACFAASTRESDRWGF